MQSHSNIRCFKLVTKNVRKGPQFPFVIHDHCQIFDIFLNSTFLTVQSQQGKKKGFRGMKGFGEESSFE